MKSKTLLLPPIAAATFLVLLIWTGSAAGAPEQVLYKFSTYAKGSEPVGNLVADAGGNLYGTTRIGGAYELGVVLKLTLSQGKWTEPFFTASRAAAMGKTQLPVWFSTLRAISTARRLSAEPVVATRVATWFSSLHQALTVGGRASSTASKGAVTGKSPKRG